MKKIVLLAGLLSSLFLSGCGSVVKKPDFYSVKKLAIVSVYSNNKIYDVKGKYGQAGVDLQALKNLVGKTDDDIDVNEMTQITTGGLEIYLTELKKLRQWTIVDPKTILNHPAYKSFKHDYVPTGLYGFSPALNMKLFPIDVVADTGSRHWQNGKEVHEEARKGLAQLCKDLNVDGVAIIQLDLAFKPTFFSGMRGTGLLSGIKAPAIPSVSSAMVIITKDGKIAAQTKPIQKAGGDRFEGDEVTMLHKGKVTLVSNDGGPVREYNRVLKMSAEALLATIQKEAAAK